MSGHGPELSPVLTTFVLADLAGYTALTEAHGDVHAADAASGFFQAARRLLARHGAEEVKTIGDAFLARTQTAAGGVALAERLVGDYGARHRTLGVRAGVHTGTAVFRGGDWFGAAVNLAARVANAAGSGEVLLTEPTYMAARSALPAGRVLSRGHQEFKNVSHTLEVFALILDTTAAVQLRIDPVCRMALDPGQCNQRTVHRGVEYHFCSADCLDRFLQHPDRFANERREP